MDYSLRTCKAPFQQSINCTILNDNDTLVDNGNGNGNGNGSGNGNGNGIFVPLKFPDIKKNDILFHNYLINNVLICKIR